jgi:hypothetical protein
MDTITNENLILLIFLAIWSTFTQIILNLSSVLLDWNYNSTELFVVSLIGFGISLILCLLTFFKIKQKKEEKFSLFEYFEGFYNRGVTQRLLIALGIGVGSWSIIAQIAWVGLLTFEADQYLAIFFRELYLIAILVGLVIGLSFSGLVPFEKEEDLKEVL